MVKKVLIIILLIKSMMFAQSDIKPNIYESNCVSCHRGLSVGLDKIFFRYLIKYSSELSVKSAMMDFLKDPNIQTSAMTDEQLRRLGVKSKTHLSDSELEKAIDIYWEKYKVFGKLW